MDYKKEIEKLREIMESSVKESVVRLFDSKTKEISFHTIGIEEVQLKSHRAWNLFFHRSDTQIIEAKNEYSLSDALNKIRAELEKEDMGLEFFLDFFLSLSGRNSLSPLCLQPSCPFT